MKNDLKEKLEYMLLRKGFKNPQDFRFYYDKKRRSWMVSYKGCPEQVVATDIHELCFKIGDGYFNAVFGI